MQGELRCTAVGTVKGGMPHQPISAIAAGGVAAPGGTDTAPLPGSLGLVLCHLHNACVIVVVFSVLLLFPFVFIYLWFLSFVSFVAVSIFFFFHGSFGVTLVFLTDRLLSYFVYILSHACHSRSFLISSSRLNRCKIVPSVMATELKAPSPSLNFFET